jgi:hypothetical protein
MAMLRVCGHPGCGTLTLGELCIELEQSSVQRTDRVRVVPVLATGSRAHRRPPDANGRRSGA